MYILFFENMGNMGVNYNDMGTLQQQMDCQRLFTTQHRVNPVPQILFRSEYLEIVVRSAYLLWNILSQRRHNKQKPFCLTNQLFILLWEPSLEKWKSELKIKRVCIFTPFKYHLSAAVLIRMNP